MTDFGDERYRRTVDSDDAHSRRANVSGEGVYHRTADSDDANERRADTSGNDCYRRAAGHRATHFSGEKRYRRSAEDDCNADDFESVNRYRRSAEGDCSADDFESENRYRRPAEDDYGTDDAFDDDFSDDDFFSVKSDYASKRRRTDERVPRNYRPARRSGTRKRRPDGEF